MREVLVINDDGSVRDALVQTLELAQCTMISAGAFVAAKDNIAADFKILSCPISECWAAMGFMFWAIAAGLIMICWWYCWLAMAVL